MMWVVWFPKDKPLYISKPLKTHSAEQALGAWLSAHRHHNNLFNFRDQVCYRGIKYDWDRGRILCDRLLKGDDWEGVEV